jgi:hypothetical protein
MLAKSVDGDMKRTMRLGLLALVLPLAVQGGQAQASFISRGLNLPNSAVELGLGLGLGHTSAIDYTGLGLNLELGYGINSNLELRARTGVRFAQAGKATDADRYGRPVETETYNVGDGAVANPEIGVRFNLVRGATPEVALDARVQLPLDGPLGLTFGVPVALRLGSRLRLDTGIFVPMRFADSGTAIDVSLPFHFWFRNGNTFFGPITGITFQNDDGPTRIPFGIGVGTPLSYDADVRFWLLFDNIKQEKKDLGVGVGLYVLL